MKFVANENELRARSIYFSFFSLAPPYRFHPRRKHAWHRKMYLYIYIYMFIIYIYIHLHRVYGFVKKREKKPKKREKNQKKEEEINEN